MKMDMDPNTILGMHTVIEIDHCSPLEIRKLQKKLLEITAGEVSGFVHGKGKKKPENQQFYEEL